MKIKNNGTPLCFRRKKPRSENKGESTYKTQSAKKGRSIIKNHGSITLEVAVVLPLTAGFFAFLLFFFRVLMIQTQVYEALSYASRKTAAMSLVSDSSVATLATAEVFFHSQLTENEYVDTYVWGGNKGILLLESDLDGDYVDLKANYRIQFPIDFFWFKGIQIYQESKSRKWNGAPLFAHDESDWVYITPEGRAYHKSRYCNYLDLTVKSTEISKIGDLRNKSEHKYYACEQCVAKNNSCKTVYYTDYGEAYHVSLNCSSLKRTISKVHISSVGGRHACSKCY